MKTQIALPNQQYQKKLMRVFTHISKKARRQYKRHGETQTGAEAIEKELLKLVSSKLISQELMQEIHPLDQYVKEDHAYYIARIVHTDSIKVALHIAPEGTTLPLHSHENMLNMLLLCHGGIRL